MATEPWGGQKTKLFITQYDKFSAINHATTLKILFIYLLVAGSQERQTLKRSC